MKFINLLSLSFIFIFVLFQSVSSARSNADCILDMVAESDDSVTIGEIKAICESSVKPDVVEGSLSPLDVRLNMDVKNRLEPFTIMAHKPNFFILSYDRSREDILNYAGTGYTADLDEVELQFQVSLKIPLAIDLFAQDIELYAAYTNRSFWQAFNDKDQNSAFFRETNHEPEIWLQKRHDLKLFSDFRYRVTTFGFVHQSNGRSGEHSDNPEALSRSWNRFYTSFTAERGNLVVDLKSWVRISEDRDEDDNYDITDYLGHGEIRFSYKLNEHTLTVMSRNNLESGFSKGALEASWSFPLLNYPYVKGYLQYFIGYGESLTDYDKYNNRIGLGVCLSDWL